MSYTVRTHFSDVILINPFMISAVKNPVTAADDDLHQSTYIQEIDKTTESQMPSTRPSSRRRTKTSTTSTTETPVVEADGDDNFQLSYTTSDKPMLTFEGDYETIEKHKVRFSSSDFMLLKHLLLFRNDLL